MSRFLRLVHHLDSVINCVSFPAAKVRRAKLTEYNGQSGRWINPYFLKILFLEEKKDSQPIFSPLLTAIKLAA
jgi:hypothetical protein